MAEKQSDTSAREAALREIARTFIKYAASEYYTASLPDKTVGFDNNRKRWRVYYASAMTPQEVEVHLDAAKYVRRTQDAEIHHAMAIQETRLQWMYLRTATTDFLTITELPARKAFIKPVPKELCAFLARIAREQNVFVDGRATADSKKAKIYPFRRVR